MKPRSTRFALINLFLASALAGCSHKVVAPPPEPAKTAPPITPASITVITPLPSVPQSSVPDVKPAPPVVQPQPAPPPPPVKRRRRLHRKPAATTDQTPAANSQAPAATTPVPAASGGTSTAAGAAAPSTAPTASGELGADKPELTSPPRTAASEAAPTLGQLSAGTTISPADRARLLRDIDAQETRLSKAREPKTPDGRTVQLQVRTFLTRARQAVTENDLDGAQTLITKARVLLDELQSE